MVEMLVALNVINEEGYSEYRKQMTPLLESQGGGFGYDFRIQEVLKSKTSDKINRVFTIYFPDQESADKFFQHQDYLAIKKKYFLESVESTTIIATYKRT